ncbi:hypothetical protein HDU99_000300 [Rhizoclosmatium hyalinum]|nr:hypothetical protein HDU99_000300 [Rhizoclosmatium hyalinum]
MSVETVNTIDTTAALSDSAAVLKPNSTHVVLIEEATEPPPAPDGGFEAWGTVIASFLVHFFERGYGSLAIIQFVGAIGSTMLVGAGFISGRLGETFGFRTMVGVGTTLMAAALVLASFCTQIWQLMITQGFLFGFGACLCYFPSISSVSQWFDKKRSVATGIAASGSGIGGLVLSLVTQKLIATVDVQWTLRVNALILFVCLGASLPLVKQRVKTKKMPTDWSVLWNRRFLLLLGTVFFAMFPNFIPSNFLPSFARDVANLSASEGALLVALYNGSSAFGRILVGFLADFLVGRINSFILCTFLSAISMLVLWPFATFNGMVSGGYFVLIPVIVGQLFGVAQMASLVGMSMTLSSIGYLAGPPIAGAIRESVGFTGVCLFAGGLTLISVFFCISVRVVVEPKLLKIV